MQGRLRNEKLVVEIATSCSHCSRPMHIVVDEQLQWRIRESGADPQVMLPEVAWATFRKPDIIGDY